MSGFLYVFYRFLKVLVRTTLRILHPRTKTLHEERLHYDYPALLLSNHPNTMIDALRAAASNGPQVFFLANASLFAHPVLNWLLHRLYCIPIQRPKDVQGQQPLRNEQSFARSYAHLARGGTMYIAPEGGSELERRLREVKTGAARIALGAEQKHDYGLNVHIIPMGLNYESPTTCFSRLLIRVGEPIRVADYRELYQGDPIRATRELTAEAAARMQALLIHTENKQEERLLRRLERSVQNDAPLPVDGHHFRTQAILSALRRLREAQPAAYAELEHKTTAYDADIRRLRVSDLGLSRHPRRRPDGWTILGLPVFLYGWLNHAPAIYVPHLLWKMLNIDRGYTTTVKYGVGLITFPLFYILQFQLAEEFLPDPWPWVYVLTLPLFGFLAWRYSEHAAPFWAVVYNKVFRSGEARRLRGARAEVLERMPKAEVETVS